MQYYSLIVEYKIEPDLHKGYTMLNMGSPGDGLEQEMGKSAFMELQQQQMQHAGAMAPYHVRGYQTQHSQMDSYGSQQRAPLGYPFPMNSMAPHSTYNHAYPFSTSGYPQPTNPSVTPPSARDGKSNTYIFIS